uniref:Uncharacterized protein n=1 Tax=Triparma laevis TaxID=1534972 RepID=A0A0K2RW58_9STRA|nr:hypothetical protein AL373_pgp139 [Triparma laevis]BAS19020.1 hypothetical protein [Triparma laevis]
MVLGLKHSKNAFFFFISTRFRLTVRIEKCQPLKDNFLYFLFKNFFFFRFM